MAAKFQKWMKTILFWTKLQLLIYVILTLHL